jgi:hypothetical protein
MLRILVAAVLAACVAAPAGALTLIFGVDMTLSRHSDPDTSTSQYLGERIFRLTPAGDSALWTIPPGGEPPILFYWFEVYPEVQDGNLVILPPPGIYGFNLFAHFDRPLRDDLSNIGLVRFVSGGFGTTDCTRYMNFPCSSAGGRITWLYVPEPATWALLVAGFALAGGALRRRRGVAAGLPVR